MTRTIDATIPKVAFPNTQDNLRLSFFIHGIVPGDVLLVHSSLSQLGWVSGGAVAVVQALMDALTPDGTLVMPTHSGDLTDPAEWQNPPVPESWWQIIRDTMPAFNPQYTPTSGMGQVVEVFRSMPGVLRSEHPALSFAAWGKHAELVTAGHLLDYALGETSPLARVYDLDGKVLLLGVGFGNNTSFHLSEARANSNKIVTQGSPVFINGERKWVEYTDIYYDDSDFVKIGDDFCLEEKVTPFKVGAANCYLFSQRAVVDFATGWIKKERGSTAPAIQLP